MAGLFGDILKFLPGLQAGGGTGLLGAGGGAPWATPGFNPAAQAPVTAPQQPRQGDPLENPLFKIGKYQAPSAKTLLQDPLTQIGLGILSNRGAGQNPWSGALQGLQGAAQNTQAFQARDQQLLEQQRQEQEFGWKQDEQKRIQEQLEREQKFREALADPNLTQDQLYQLALQNGSPELQEKLLGGLFGAQYDPTSQMKNYGQLRDLIETYGRDSQEVRDFMSTFREDPTMRAGTQSFVFDAFSSANTYQANAYAANDVASRLEAAAGKLPNGWQSKGEELIKEVFGTQDDYTILRRDIQKQINANVLQALPPGPATDRDISEAKKGFPPADANAETLASYFRGVAKAQERKAAFEEFKARWASENPSTRGMMDAWYQEYARLFPQDGTQGGKGGLLGEQPVVDTENLEP